MPTSNPFGQPVGDPVPGWTPPPHPAVDALAGRTVRVEALTATHLPELYAATCRPGVEAAWTYLPAEPPGTPEELHAYLELMARAGWAPFALLMPDADGRWVVQGMCAYLRITPAAGSVEIGAILFGPELRRTTAATEAMTLLAEHTFALGYRRYEWKCDALNAPSRRAAARLGFTYEGTFRQALVSKGRNRDTAWFAITDDEWPRLRAAHEAWLDDAVAGPGAPAPSLGDRTAAVLAGRT